MAKRKTRISKLRVNEVSLVDRPANPVSRVLLAKRAEDDQADKDMCSYCGDKKAVAGGSSCEDCSKMSKAYDYNAMLDTSIESILSDPELTPSERTAYLSKTVDQFRDSILALETPDSSDADTTATLNKEDTTPMAENVSKSEVVELLKTLSPEQSAAVETLIAKAAQVQTAALTEKIEKAEKAAKDARDEITKRDRISKAQSMVGKTNIAPDAVVKVLEATGDNADVTAFLADVLAKLNTAMQAGKVLDEIGSDRSGEADANTELNKKIELIQKGDSKLTYEQAFAKAISQNPALYDEMLKTK